MRDDDTLDDRCAAPDPADRSDDGSSSEPVAGRRSLPGLRHLAQLSRIRLGTFGNLRSAEKRPGRRPRLVPDPGRGPTALPRRVRAALIRPGRGRVALAAGVVCCLGLTLIARTSDPAGGGTARTDRSSVDLVERATPDAASRGRARPAVPSTAPATVPTVQPAEPSAPAATADPDTEPAPEKRTPRPKPVDPGPVAGLTVAQMDNAKVIVRTGCEMRLPRRALIIAVATAMQESSLYNVASGVLPESQNYPHQGIGWDHDSVGLFQQRSSSGWGPVGRLMDPAFATRQFLTALLRVPGWQQMRLTDAAQAVQISAFPEHYAKHEARSTEVVDAIVNPGG